jgi:hypothetical protein
MAELNRSTTDSGLTVYDEFTDTYDHEVRVVESSASGETCCWIVAGATMTAGGRPASAHLNVEQAKRVRDALDAFISEYGDDQQPR